MISFSFENALILEARQGVSKSGNTYGTVRFLDQSSLEVYDLMQFGDAAAVCAGLVKGSTVQLDFNLTPAREGGVRLTLVGVGRV